MRRAYGGRHGRYPVLMMDSHGYQPFAVIVMAAVSRWAYRHRSAFAPFLITAGLFVAAAILHRDHPGSWIAVIAGTTIAAFVLGMPHQVIWAGRPGKTRAGFLIRAWEASGITRPAERAYAATVTATGGGWLAAAIAAGPFIRPLPRVAEIGTMLLGIPWWAHRRRRARVRALKTVQAWPSLADNAGLPGSRIASIVIDAWGWTARIILRKGTTAAQAIERLPAIESALGIRPGSARVIPDQAKADRVFLRVMETDPHANAIPWPGTAVTTIRRPVELGLFEDGRTAGVMILRRNVLIGGTTGAGKSGVLNIILAVLAACPDVILWGIDLKGGIELQPWASCLGRLATTPQQAINLLADAITELDNRAATMAAAGRRLWEPAPGRPALIIVADEYAELPPGAQDHADSLARRGRAVAVSLIAATQRPTQDAMGGNAVRSQMDVRVCLRVRERRDVDLILGQGSFAAGWHAHALTRPGELLISDPEHAVPERARAYLIDDARVTAHAGQHARARDAGAPEWPPAAPGSPQPAERPDPGIPGGEPVPGDGHDPGAALWEALSAAPPAGITVGRLVAASGMSRRWVYYRLREYAAAGWAVQVAHGSWRAVTAPLGPEGHPG
jgi:S-DNA-T family DNA segregation ATPase FtsK/SpoIIIE